MNTRAGTPLLVLVRRYECPHCRRRRANKAATVEHMGRCWYNPASRTCKTCVLFERSDCCGMADVYGCYTPMCPTDRCTAGVDLPAAGLMVGCPAWSDTPTEVTR